MSEQQRLRRFDPDRRQRIIDAAVEVIATSGVAGTTHRRVAAQAGVPLGSLTYHFSGLDDLLHAAFEQVAEVGSRDMLTRLEQVKSRDEAIMAVVDVITGNLWSTPRLLLLSYELYAYAARRPLMEEVMRGWMKRSRAALELYFDPLTARAIDALIEGIGIHNSVDARPLDRSEVEHIVRRVAGSLNQFA